MSGSTSVSSTSYSLTFQEFLSLWICNQAALDYVVEKNGRIVEYMRDRMMPAWIEMATKMENEEIPRDVMLGVDGGGGKGPLTKGGGNGAFYSR